MKSLILIGLKEFENAIKGSFNRLSTSIIIAFLLLGSSLLLSSEIPPLFKGVSIFGIVGFLFATILGIILIFTVLKEK